MSKNGTIQSSKLHDGRPPVNAPNETSEPISDVVASVTGAMDREQVSLGDLIRSAGHISFTPLLFLPALAVETPLSGIPLFSTTMGILIFLVAAQMLMQRDHLWLPNWLLNLQTGTARIQRRFDQLAPVTSWLDRHTHQRLTFLVRKPLVFIPQLLCLVSGFIIPFLEFVPFSSSLIGTAVALLALGMMARDGVILLIAFVPYIGVGWLLLRLL